jgi:CHAP domain
MTEWWQQAYPGGPMVAVRGFPRPLHPPDAKGYPASVNGSDVEAYKRTCSRAGRWRWVKFDQAFSNGFSHGKPPGNVGESGIEGVQRQQKMQATGYVGRDTFNLLRSIRIPAGLPHAGEAAMDARSVELINAAWDRFGGEEPKASKGESTASLRLANAIGEIGYVEGSGNQTKYGAWYGMDGVPWCAIFVSWCDQTSGRPSSSFEQGSAYSYVPYIVDDARHGYNGLWLVSSPKPGDLVCYDWSRDGEHDHVGIFESGSPGGFYAIEGNTSPADNSNGGQVMRRSRSTGDAAILFVRVGEP